MTAHLLLVIIIGIVVAIPIFRTVAFGAFWRGSGSCCASILCRAGLFLALGLSHGDCFCYCRWSVPFLVSETSV